jgi:hypothetical protein
LYPVVEVEEIVHSNDDLGVYVSHRRLCINKSGLAVIGCDSRLSPVEVEVRLEDAV